MLIAFCFFKSLRNEVLTVLREMDDEFWRNSSLVLVDSCKLCSEGLWNWACIVRKGLSTLFLQRME